MGPPQKELLAKLFLACERGNKDDVLKLVKQLKLKKLNRLHDEDGNNPLHLASLSSSLELVNFLADAGCNVNGMNSFGFTPVHWSAQAGTSLILSRLSRLKAKTMIHARSTGQTPLHLATEFGHQSCVQRLLDLGCNVNATDKFGSTPLHYACKRGHTEVVQILLNNNALILQNKAGDTPMHLASQCGAGDIVGLLIEYGGNIKLINKKGLSALDTHDSQTIIQHQGPFFHWTSQFLSTRLLNCYSSVV